jgi:hypothetical protein
MYCNIGKGNYNTQGEAWVLLLAVIIYEETVCGGSRQVPVLGFSEHGCEY